MSPEILNGIFALTGAIIGVGGTWFITHRFKERKRIAVIVSPLARMLDVGDRVKSEVQITFRGNLIGQLSMGEIALQNIGTTPVEALEATLTSPTDSQLLDLSVSSANFAISKAAIHIEGDDKAKTIRLDYLNVNDRVVLSYKLAGARKSLDVVVRKLGVEVAITRDYVGWIPDIYAEVVYGIFSSMPLFNYVGRFVRPYRLFLEARKKNVTLEKSG